MLPFGLVSLISLGACLFQAPQLTQAALHLHPAIQHHHSNFLLPSRSHARGVFSNSNNEAQSAAQYEPTWESLDKRPLPAWYDDVKVGIFVHWGVFSVPAYKTEWMWYNWKGPKPDTNTVNYVKRNFPPNIAYGDFARDLSARWYDANEWADLFVQSGAKYVVLTSKHHEGYCMWNSSYCWQWNSMAVGPQRDIVGELATAVKARTATDGIRFGLYHSLYEWFNPLWQQDVDNDFKTTRFSSQKTMPELYELVEKYSPEVVWSDGDWSAPDTYWNSTAFLAWLVNESPVRDTVVFNDRWGSGTICNHGSFRTCEDRHDPGKLLKFKWENCMTLDRQSWGYRRDMKVTDVLPTAELIGLMVRTVSCGGNILINVGPTEDGIIVPIFQERLLQLGAWLKVNGDAIYSTKPYTTQNDTYSGNVWYTAKKSAAAQEISAANNNVVFAIILANTTNAFGNIAGVTLGSIPIEQVDSMSVLGNAERKVIWKQSNDAPQGTDVMLPPLDGAPEVLQWGTVLQITLK